MHSHMDGHFGLPALEHTFGLRCFVGETTEMAAAEQFIQRLKMRRTMPGIFAARWIAVRTENVQWKCS